jgi:hypothetical protein
MAHGILGDEAGRADWARISEDLVGGQQAIGQFAWAGLFDALVALHYRDACTAFGRLAIDIDDPAAWWDGGITMYRPWYAAVWVESAVLAGRDDATDRIERARRAARDNPITAAMVERAAAIAARDRGGVAALAATFAALGCPYQQARTNDLAEAIPQ